MLNRMTLDAIKGGKLTLPFRIYLYGVEGLGKTTWAAGAPDPVFLGAEHGTGHLDVQRFPMPENLEDVRDAIATLRDTTHNLKTMVVDTIDWLEPLVAEDLCQKAGKETLEDFGYGKGYVALERAFRELLAGNQAGEPCFMDLWKRGMHVIFLGHAKKKAERDPTLAQDYDRWVPKAHEKVTAVVKEWCDTVLFGQYEVVFRKDEKKGVMRAFDTGTRILKTNWSAGADAKNRQDLPAILPLDWSEFYHAARRGPDVDPEEIKKAILDEIVKLPGNVMEAAKAELAKRLGNTRALLHLLDHTKARVIQLGSKKED